MPGEQRNKRASRCGRWLLSRFLASRDGATAIEFGMLVIPFSLLVFAVLESCISFAGQQVLANATDDIARQIRTGQFKRNEITTAEIQKRLCAKISIMVASGCPGLSFDLQQFTTFQDAAAVRIEYEGRARVRTKDVTTGGPSTINMLRVFYKWPVITDFLRKSMSNFDDNTILQFASVTWQNEPFDE
ncbi:MAG: pilus assembly protein [Methylobacterium mesophilicum]|nr:pilus assembly protein [Methylobacterium mesophilicum]